MGFYEHWVPFIHFGTLVGLFPYRIKSNGKVKQFVFSWCHPLTLWCVLALILQFSPIIGLIIFFRNLEKIRSTEQTDAPKSITILALLGAAFNYVMILVSRRITYRYTRLSAAVNSITTKIIMDLEEKLNILPSCQNSTKKRTNYGVIVILASVCKCSTTIFAVQKKYYT